MAHQSTALSRALDNRHVLGLLFLLPAAAIMLVFLTYPLGLGTWLGFTDAKVGRSGVFIGLDNFQYLWGDAVTRLALFNTIFYTVVASIIKFALGLWLALLLNKHLPFKAFIRAIVLLPFIVPTALSALAFWWIYDSQFSVISWVLMKLGIINAYIDFLGDPWNARFATIAANIWRGVPFVAISLLAGLQTISPSYYEAASLDGASEWQQFRHVTLPLLTPIIAVVMTFSVLFTFTDFQLIYVLTRGGPYSSTHVFGTYAYEIAMRAAKLGQGASISLFLFPFLLMVIVLQLWYIRRSD
jgi:multiple sugar transport system permease protein